MIGDKKGFTLIELIVAMGSVLIVVGILSTIVFLVIQSQRLILTQRETTNNTRLVIDIISRYTRLAVKYEGENDRPKVCVDYGKFFKTNSQKDNISFIAFDTISEQFLCYNIFLDLGEVKINEGGQISNLTELTEVKITGLRFEVEGDEVVQLERYQPYVLVKVNAEEGEKFSTNSSIDLQTTISTRGLNRSGGSSSSCSGVATSRQDITLTFNGKRLLTYPPEGKFDNPALSFKVNPDILSALKDKAANGDYYNAVGIANIIDTILQDNSIISEGDFLEELTSATYQNNSSFVRASLSDGIKFHFLRREVAQRPGIFSESVVRPKIADTINKIGAANTISDLRNNANISIRMDLIFQTDYSTFSYYKPIDLVETLHTSHSLSYETPALDCYYPVGSLRRGRVFGPGEGFGFYRLFLVVRNGIGPSVDLVLTDEYIKISPHSYENDIDWSSRPIGSAYWEAGDMILWKTDCNSVSDLPATLEVIVC